MLNKTEKLAVLAILQEQAQDTSLPELLELLGPGYSERTIRRWLAEMVVEGLVKKSGKKRGTRYRADSEIISTLADSQIYFSEKSCQVIQKINQPIFERSPVTYNQEWINSYAPNVTSYLSETLKIELHQIGVQSKAQLPAGTYARHIYNRLLIDLSYNSSRLEGNTYSLLDTQRLILEGTRAEGKLDEERIMILNHKEAIAHLVNRAHQIEVGFNEVCTLHYLLADGLVPTQYAGKVRDYGVRISGSTYIPWENPEKIKQQLHGLCQKAACIQNPFEQSFFLLVQIAYLQAFVDVNKRTSRLSANIPLIQHNLVPLSFNDVANDDYTSAMIAIYELNDLNPLIELYTYSYSRTCQLYAVTTEALGFDEIRVHYRQQRRQMIGYIIAHGLTHEAMHLYIQEQAKNLIDKKDQSHFIEDVEDDLQEINQERIAGIGVTAQQLDVWLRKMKKLD